MKQPSLVLLALLAAVPAKADISLPAVFGDHMVLQRETEAPVWGWAAPGEKIVIEPGWDAATVEVAADARGRWIGHVATPEAGGPYTLSISGRNRITLNDILIGEVWLCSGQSNMEWPLERVGNAEEEIMVTAMWPDIRLFQVPNEVSALRRRTGRGEWAVCAPNTAAGFSAVGYFFGRDVHAALEVPVGLISAEWGGTRAQAWMPEEALRSFGGFDDALDTLVEFRDPNTRGRHIEDRIAAWWTGLDADDATVEGGGWTGPDFDDRRWMPMDVPATWSGTLGGFDGLVYFRRAFELPDGREGAAAALELGPIDDYDDVWVNGRHVGAVHQPGRWQQPRRYEVPAGVLRAGGNVVAVRVLDTGGLGGINGRPDQLRLVFGDETHLPLAGEWSYLAGRAAADLPPRPTGPTINHNHPSVLFNGMIAPLVPYAIRGAIWYQGESDRDKPARYAELFPAMIRSWRKEWARGDFPFYFVQIAPFNYHRDAGQTAELREAQAAALALPNTGMAVTLDIGERNDIHPVNKQDVGYRLAQWALAETYTMPDTIPSGPMLRSFEVSGSSMRLTFDHVTGKLIVRPNRHGRFIIAGDDRQFYDAVVEADGDTLVLSSPRVPQPVAARYAWAASPQASLYDWSGLPAAPFRTDDWSEPLPPLDNNDEMTGYRATGDGFVELFNGRDLAGWHNVNGADSTWQFRDGVVVCSGVPTGVLRTERQYENFELELEWRHLRAAGNAGVFVWSDPLPVTGKPFPRAIEVQVMDGRDGDGFTSDGDIFPIQGAGMTTRGRHAGSRAFPEEWRANPAPLWNHYLLRCVDGSIELAVNGRVVTRGYDCVPRKGYLCLESEGSPVEFRNVRLRELPGGNATPNVTARVDEGFVPLYNGVDFTGWKHDAEHEGHWRAANWLIDFDGRGPDLWTERSYRDFVLICDWRWSGQPRTAELPVVLPSGDYDTDADGKQLKRSVADAGDSGIYLRGSSKSQVNMWCWPIGSGEVYGYRTDSKMPADVRAGVTPSSVADHEIGQWNRFVITMRGDRLTVVLNGTTVIDDARLPGVAESGPIALQQHGSPIQFANLYIRELP